MNLVNVVKRRVQSAMDSVRATALAFRLFFLGLIGLSLSTGANAAALIDTSAVVSAISEGVTIISAIGVAILSLVVVIKLFKWVQRVL
ncbi:major capsid protein [Giesbergeria anulus]|uniref:Bacteriophage coat protein B n=1 Tax=Giesbergeria anulus TaxID=180197 RepID=A0A1H9KTC7_9BURK|nr:major capsid protein [Giesbergeria anulus]SER02382.1 Bacteriophage coat protein B [Giesbergeria anulus]